MAHQHPTPIPAHNIVIWANARTTHLPIPAAACGRNEERECKLADDTEVGGAELAAASPDIITTEYKEKLSKKSIIIARSPPPPALITFKLSNLLKWVGKNRFAS